MAATVAQSAQPALSGNACLACQPIDWPDMPKGVISPAILAFADPLEPFPAGKDHPKHPEFNEISEERWVDAQISGLKNMVVGLNLVQHFRVGTETPEVIETFRQFAESVMTRQLHGHQHHFYRADDILYFLDVEQPLKNHILRVVWDLEPDEIRWKK